MSPLAVTTSPVTVATAAKLIGAERVTYKSPDPNEEEELEAALGKIKAPVQTLTVPTLRKTIAEHSRVLVVFFNKEDKAFPLLVDDVSGAKAELTKLGVTVAMVDGVAAGEGVREEFKAYGDMPNFVLVRDGVFRPIRGYPENDELITFVKKRLELSMTHLSTSDAHKAHSLLAASNAIALALLHSLKSQSLAASSAIALGLLHSLTGGWCASILLSLLLLSARLSLLISLLVSLPARLPVSQPPAPHTHKAHSLLAAFSTTIAVALLHSLKVDWRQGEQEEGSGRGRASRKKAQGAVVLKEEDLLAGGRASRKKAQGAVVLKEEDLLAGGRASMKKAQGAVVFRTDNPLAGYMTIHRASMVVIGEKTLPLQLYVRVPALALSLPTPVTNSIACPVCVSPFVTAGGRASMKKAQGAVVFRTDDPLAGRDYRPSHARRQPRLLGRFPVGRAGVHCGVPVGVWASCWLWPGIPPAHARRQPRLWEGSQWDVLGCIAEYLWVFGIVLAVSANQPPCCVFPFLWR
ncbi:unnamed protein product [Closterium sp. NIES-65]|nr:unnamed protein product [Closterium sp. NIES-65]